MINAIKIMKTKSFGLIIIALLMTSAMLMMLPAKAQSVVTNVQPSGGVVNIPSGVTPDYTI